VIPDYEGKIEFVNAITDDASGRQLAEQLPFAYIPMSIFFGANGDKVASQAGALTEAQMRAYLDSMLPSPSP